MSDHVGLSVNQFGDAWRLWCGGSPARSIGSEGGVEYIFSGVPIGFFNVAVLTAGGVSSDGLRAHGRARVRVGR